MCAAQIGSTGPTTRFATRAPGVHGPNRAKVRHRRQDIESPRCARPKSSRQIGQKSSAGAPRGARAKFKYPLWGLEQDRGPRGVRAKFFFFLFRDSCSESKSAANPPNTAKATPQPGAKKAVTAAHRASILKNLVSKSRIKAYARAFLAIITSTQVVRKISDPVGQKTFESALHRWKTGLESISRNRLYI